MEEHMRCACSYHTGNVGKSEKAGLATSEDSRKEVTFQQVRVSLGLFWRMVILPTIKKLGNWEFSKENRRIKFNFIE